ncbi:MAG: hypothetical protein VKJ24_11950 [Synechococcales bacterium]|nr:hypothetical protein [Synechococcales bacterium]
MAGNDPQVSACRHCKHYLLEGRRGGHCTLFNAQVQGSWESCQLAIPFFSPVLAVEPLLGESLLGESEPILMAESVVSEPCWVEPLHPDPRLKTEAMSLTAIDCTPDSSRIVA